MILYQNGLILNYDPITGILTVDELFLKSYTLPETRHNLEILVKTIRNFNIKKLLLVGCKTIIHPIVDTTPNKGIIHKFNYDLAQTSLKKMASINNDIDLMREALTHDLIEQIKHKTNLTFQHQNFTSKAEAIKWLTVSNKLRQLKYSVQVKSLLTFPKNI